jgi:hypothetical protein
MDYNRNKVVLGQAMKRHGRLELLLHPFLTSALIAVVSFTMRLFCHPPPPGKNARYLLNPLGASQNLSWRFGEQKNNKITKTTTTTKLPHYPTCPPPQMSHEYKNKLFAPFCFYSPPHPKNSAFITLTHTHTHTAFNIPTTTNPYPSCINILTVSTPHL